MKLKIAGGSHTDDEWRQLCDRYDNRCLKCGEKKPLAKDHVVPVCIGGGNEIENIQPLCHSCNTSKWGHAIDYRPDAVPVRLEYEMAILKTKLEIAEKTIAQYNSVIERLEREKHILRTDMTVSENRRRKSWQLVCSLRKELKQYKNT